MHLHASPRAKNPKAAEADVSEFLPRTLIAGALPMAKGVSAPQVAYHAASLALDTERVCLITSVSEDKVSYLAGAAADFASAGPATTLLACALPGIPAHRGWGVYYGALPGNAGTACVISTASGIKCFVGSEADAQRFPAAEQLSHLPVHHIAEMDCALAALPQWHSFTEHQRSDNRLLLKRLQIFGAANVAVMAAVWLGSSLYIAQTSAESADLEGQARAAIAKASEAYMNKGGGRHPAWHELQNVSRFVLSHRGRLLKFNLKDRRISWSIEVPDFVTGEEIGKAFGRGIQTRREGGMIRVTRNGDGL